MKLSNPKFLAMAGLIAMLAAPAGVLAHRRPDYPKPGKGNAVPEPSTLVLTVVGMSLGIGLIFAGVRRNRSTVTA